MRESFNQRLGSEFGQVVAQTSQSIVRGSTAECLDDIRIDCRGRNGCSSGNVRKSDNSVHEYQLARVIQFEARHTFAVRQDGGFGESAQLSPVNKRLQNVLLDILIGVVDGRKFLPKLG